MRRTFAGLSVIACLGWACSKQESTSPAKPKVRALASIERHTEGGYVGSEACVTCHEATHASWHRSFHRTMTQRPSAQSVVGRFDGAALDRKGEYRAFERDGAYIVRSPSSRGLAKEQSVELVTGSHHMQVYWVRGERGVLEAFAFAFLIPQQRWVPNEWTLLRPPAHRRAERGEPIEAVYTWNRVCVKCHAVDGVPGFDEDSGKVRSTVAQLGIACEACHGPAQAHVEARTADRAAGRTWPQETSDPTIVDPRELGKVGASEVCAQCHSITVFHDDVAWVRQGRDAPPPSPLSAWGKVVRHPLRANAAWIDDLLAVSPDFMAQRFWSDGQVRVSGREYNGLIESACFESGELGCTSCHRMHEGDEQVDGLRWVDGQLAAGAREGEMCGKCHAEVENAGEAHSHHGPVVRCVDCHMPRTTYGLLGAIRSHTIDSPSIEATRITGRPNACNACHIDRSLRWAEKWLHDWYDAPFDAGAGSSDEPAIARWAVAGDAGQRALAVWHLGWPRAHAASKAPWARTLLQRVIARDPYPAVRLVAERALEKLGDAEDQGDDLDSTTLDAWERARDERPVRLAE